MRTRGRFRIHLNVAGKWHPSGFCATWQAAVEAVDRWEQAAAAHGSAVAVEAVDRVTGAIVARGAWKPGGMGSGQLPI